MTFKKGDPRPPGAGRQLGRQGGRIASKEAFAAEYVRTGNITRASKAVGYKTANGGLQLLKDPEVQELIKTARAELQKEVKYSLERAMEEIDETIQFSRETQNANAMAKAVELRLKLHGMLIEKHQHMGLAPLQININGIDDAEPKTVAIEAQEPISLPPPETPAGDSGDTTEDPFS